jgi:hypothetical protein
MEARHLDNDLSLCTGLSLAASSRAACLNRRLAGLDQVPHDGLLTLDRYPVRADLGVGVVALLRLYPARNICHCLRRYMRGVTRAGIIGTVNLTRIASKRTKNGLVRPSSLRLLWRACRGRRRRSRIAPSIRVLHR